MKKENGYLRRLPEGFSKGNYFGFTLKKDFLYGENADGSPIACTVDNPLGKCYLYTYTGNKWQRKDVEFKDILSLIICD